MSPLFPISPTSQTRITIEGKTYQSVEEMPADVRRRYEQAMSVLSDRDGNGVPDVLEGDSPDPNVISHVTTSQRVFVNGREYENWDEVPHGLRRLMEAGVGLGTSRRMSFQLNPGALLAILLAAGLIGAGVLWLITR